ncbi:DUF305 domain-containing protein [Nocardioides sp. W3-2-3]|nr:DUF305 domain-containing protein [Nocardioides convexus]
MSRLVTWLTDWDQPIPDTMRDHVNAGHGDSHGPIEFSGDVGSDLPGMPSVGEVNALARARDPAFETQWLELLAAHHRGAVESRRDRGGRRPLCCRCHPGPCDHHGSAGRASPASNNFSRVDRPQLLAHARSIRGHAVPDCTRELRHGAIGTRPGS